MVNEIKDNTNILFRNIEELFESVTDSDLGIDYDKWTIGEQFQHIFKSMSIWFINPSENYPELLNDKLTKQNLTSLYSGIKTKISDYLDSLSDDDLLQNPENCDYSRLDLIFGQTRHIMYHLGLINGLLNLIAERDFVYTGFKRDRK